MSYTLTITAETPEELIAAIKGVAAPYLPTAAPVNPTPAPVGTHGIGALQVAPSAPVTPVLAPPPTPTAPVQPSVPLAAAPTYTLDQIAKAGAELAQAGKMNELLALLQQFGIQAVTQLKPEQVGPFATALRGLGAQL